MTHDQLAKLLRTTTFAALIAGGAAFTAGCEETATVDDDGIGVDVEDDGVYGDDDNLVDPVDPVDPIDTDEVDAMDRTDGAMNDMGNSIERGVDDAGNAVQAGMENTERELEEVGNEAGSAIDEAMNNADEATD